MLITTAFIAGGVAVLAALGWLASKCYSIFASKKSVSVSYTKNSTPTPEPAQSPSNSYIIRRALPGGADNNVKNVSSSREVGFTFFGRSWFSRKTTHAVDVSYHHKKHHGRAAKKDVGGAGRMVIPDFRPRTESEEALASGKHKRSYSC